MSSAQDELLGQLDSANAEAQTARWELVEAHATIVAREEEACHEREVSAAARRRADAVERQVADHEREVRSAAVNAVLASLPMTNSCGAQEIIKSDVQSTLLA